MRMTLAVVGLVVCACVAGVVRADDAPPLPKRVALLIKQLGHSEYAQREAAQQAMLELPVEALPIVADHLQHTEDAEIRMRLRLYATAVFDKHVLPHHPGLRRPGFLGIAQSLIVVNNVPQIVIVNVIPGTGAEAAGLQVDDRVLSMNGKALDQHNPIETLSSDIKALRAGQQIKLEILRAGKRMDVKATLGELPDDQLTPEQRVTMIERRGAIEKHWFEHAFKKGRLEPIHDLAPAN